MSWVAREWAKMNPWERMRVRILEWLILALGL
jgi:hypothetical protein